jgi:tetratricopeptide (TPR) repeat protein
MRARVGLALMLVWRAHYFGGAEPAKDIARAETLATSVLAAEPNNAQAHYAKAELHFYRKQFDDTLSELKAVLENDRNLASADAFSGAVLAFLGRPEETIAYEETALRLGPRDTNRHVWEGNICLAYALMAQWEKVVEWCHKSISTNPGLLFPYADLAAANAWLSRDAEAKAAVADLLKLNPSFTAQDYLNFDSSDDPTFKREYARIAEGLRKAGLPEGQANPIENRYTLASARPSVRPRGPTAARSRRRRRVPDCSARRQRCGRSRVCLAASLRQTHLSTASAERTCGTSSLAPRQGASSAQNARPWHPGLQTEASWSARAITARSLSFLPKQGVPGLNRNLPDAQLRLRRQQEFDKTEMSLGTAARAQTRHQAARRAPHLRSMTGGSRRALRPQPRVV